MDASSTGSSSGLGKLLPKAMKDKRRRKREALLAAEASVSGSDEVPSPASSRERSLYKRQGTMGSDGTGITEHTDHADDMMMMPEADASSQLSYDSDPESSFVRPTAISTHPSQIAYLTTSSPLVQAAHNLESQPLDAASPVARLRRRPTEAQHTFGDGDGDNNNNGYNDGDGDGDSNNNNNSNNSNSHLAVDSFPALPRDEVEDPRLLTKRSVSASRLRDVFRSKKKNTFSSTATSSPERRPPSGDTTTDLSASAAPEADSQPGFAEAPTEEVSIIASPPPTAHRRRPSRVPKIDTRPPRTPPQVENTPLIVNTPPTPPSPPDSDHPASIPTDSSRSRNNSNASLQGPVIQRRSRAGSATLVPSKLSNITPAPLTPTLEIAPPTPGNSTTNFFSSMISAVQSTANTLSSSIASTTGSSKNKQPAQPAQPEQQGNKEEDTVEVESSPEAVEVQSMDSKEPAVKTLGMGDLSLSQLGIMEPTSNTPTPVTAKLSDSHDSRTRSESAPAESQQAVAEVMRDELQHSRTQYFDAIPNDDRTPPTGSIYEGNSGVKRAGSIRSAIGRRRKRGGSLATGGTNASGVGGGLGGTTTIGAAIVAANASLAHPNAQGSTPKLTGFAVATKKRNRDFHSQFKSVPDDDYLIEDYSCALQREILVHGRLYVSEGHLCFSSNIFGWVTTLVMSFDEIVSVEKRSTALVFKNGLEISTLHAKHIFASFTSRDTTYDLIVKIWKLGHPSLQSSLNGVRLEGTGGDRTEKVDTESLSAAGSQSLSGSDVESEAADEDVYDEDEENVEGPDITQASDIGALEPQIDKAVTRKPSGAVATNGATEKSDDSGGGGPGDDFPGPATHAPTDCGDAATHYDKVIGDEIIPAPLGKVYSMVFGPESVTWMARFLAADQKCTEFQMDDRKGLTEDNRSRGYTYIKPLSGSIGPKQTKCITTEQLEHFDLERAVNITCSTQNPDVPSGNVFSVKTKYCLSWADNNSTRFQANCTIEWTGKSWLKVPIEKGANDGQTQYCKDLFAAIKASVSSRARTGTLNGAGALKAGAGGKKKGRKGKLAAASTPTSDAEAAGALLAKKAQQQDWGLFEPARPLLGPVVDTIRPLLTGNVVYGLLVGLLVAAWFGFGTRQQPARPPFGAVIPAGGAGVELGYVDYHRRLAAYDEMWRREESELWDWIEERVGLERLVSAERVVSSPLSPSSSSSSRFSQQQQEQQQQQAAKRKLKAAAAAAAAAEPRSMEEKLHAERMDERELREAIRVTEERLKVLKEVVERERGDREKRRARSDFPGGDRGLGVPADPIAGAETKTER